MKNKRIQALEARRDAITAELTKLDDLVIERSSDLTDEERATYEAHEAELKEITAEHAKLIERERLLSESIKLGQSLSGGNVHRSAIHVGNGVDEAANFKEFFVNVLRSKLNNDPEAQAYIARSNEEQREILRATDTAALPGIIIPSYEKAVQVPVEAGRRFTSTLTRRNVTGEVVHLPTVDDALEPGFQSTQNSSFTEVSYGTTDATYTVRTLGAFSDISVQSLDFASISPTDILNELQRGYNRKVEREALLGSADAAGSLLGLVNTPNVPTIDGSGVVDGTDLWELLNEAFADLDDDTLADEVPHVALSRRMWNAVKATLTEKHPLLNFGFGMQAGDARGSGIYDFGDFRFVVTNNVRTPAVESPPAPAEDRAVIYLPSKVWFYEANGGHLTTITDAVSVAGSGSVRIVARNYVNFPGVRPNPGAAAVIDGLDPFAVGSSSSSSSE